MTPEGDGGREDEIHHGHGRGVPSSVILRVALPLISTQFSWAVQSAFATTLFKQLGATQRDLSYLRVPGPVTGLFVQPLSGAFTDYTGFRWRPITVLACTSLCACGFLVLPLGEKNRSIPLVFLGFCVIDVSFNAADALVRVLVADITEPRRLPLANSIVSGALGAGQLLGFASGAAGEWLSRALGGRSITSLSFACLTGLCLLVACDLAFLTACRSKAFPKKSGGGRYEALGDDGAPEEAETTELVGQPGREPSRSIGFGVLWRRPWMRRLCVMNFAAWLAWFSFIYFAPDFLGVVVMGGDPHAEPGTPSHDRYDKAQTIYSASQALAAALMLSFSAVVPRLVRRFGLRRMMGASSIALATLLGAANLLRRGDEVPSFILFALTGIPWSMTMSLPYTVVSQLSSEHERGRLMGCLNVFIVLASFASLALVGATGASSEKMLNVGAASGLVAGLLFLTCKIDDSV